MALPLSLSKAHQALIRVNVNCSKHSTDNNLSTFSVSLPGQYNQLRNVLGCQVLSMTIPMAFDNVTSSNNTITLVQEDANNVKQTDVISIPAPGYYDILDIGSILSDGEQLTSSGTTHQIPLNVNIDGGASPELSTSSGASPLVLEQTERSTWNWSINRFVIEVANSNPVTISGGLAGLLGFYTAETNYTPQSATDDSGNTVWVVIAPRLPSLIPFNEFYVGCRELAQDSMLVDHRGGHMTDIIAVVPMGPVPRGGILHYEPQSPLIYEYFQGKRSINRLHFVLRDCLGNPLPFRGNDWFITLKIFYTLSY